VSEERTIDAEVEASMKANASVGPEEATTTGQGDRASGTGRSRPTLRMAKYAVAIENGAKSKYQGMIEADYSPSYARLSASASVSVEQALAAKAVLLPNAPTNRTINEISKAKLVERLNNDPSDQLLVTAYKTSGDAVIATGEDEHDPQESRDMAEIRLGLACRHLHDAMFYARLGARFGAARVVAALQARLDELLPNKSFELSLWPMKGKAERDELEHLHSFTNVMLGELLAGSGDATDYRRARERGFPLLSAPTQRGRWMDRP